MRRLLRILRYFVRNRGSLWGIRWFRASHGFFLGYVAIIAGGWREQPWLIASGLAWSLLIELSYILARKRRRTRLTSWHVGLVTRSWWRILLATAAMAAANASTMIVAATAAAGFGYQLLSGFIRSSLFHLDSGRRLRPIGSLAEAGGLLQAARDVGHRRNRVQIPIQIALLGTMASLAVGVEAAWSDGLLVGIAVAIGAGAIAIVGSAGIAVRRVSKPLRSGYDDEVIAAFHEFDAQVICYFNGEPLSMFALNVWLDVFAASRHRIAVVLRHSGTWRLRSDKVPGVVVRSAVKLERLPTAATSVVLYPANGMHNAHMMRDVTLSHVFLGHGDSDKASSVRPMNRAYDKLWVAGQAAIDRYRSAGFEIPGSRFEVVGRPLLSPRVRALGRDETDAEGPHARLAAALAENDPDGRPLTIVYAPTTEGYFEDSNYTSLATMGELMIAVILDEFQGVRVIFKPHPMSGHRLGAMRSAGRQVRRLLQEDEKQFHPHTSTFKVDLYDWFDLADVLITDVSSLATDWLAWDKPLVVTNPKQIPSDEFAESFPVTRAGYVLEGSGEGIAEILDKAFGTDPLADTRRELRKHYLGDPDTDPMDAFDDALADLIANPPARVTHSRARVSVPVTDMSQPLEGYELDEDDGVEDDDHDLDDAD